MPLDFEHSFGFKLDKKSIAFLNEHTLALTTGKLCISYDLDTGHQRPYHLTEHKEISAIKRTDLFILVAIKSVPPSVCFFKEISEKNKLYIGPRTLRKEHFVALSLSESHAHIAAVSGFPSQTIVIWHKNSNKPLTTLNPCTGEGSRVNDISFSPSKGDTLVVAGENVFKLYEYRAASENGSATFVERSFGQYEKQHTYFSIAWPLKEYIAVGGPSGMIRFFRGTDFVHEMLVHSNLNRCMKYMDREDCLRLTTTLDVSKVCTAPNKLVCLLSGVVIMVYQGEEITKFKLVRFILVPSSREPQANVGKDFLITFILSREGRSVVGVTEGGQLMHGNITKSRERREISLLSHLQHDEPIIVVDAAVSRHLFASASQHFLILWNHKRKIQELRRHFSEKIGAMALHPSGFFLALGFEETVITYNVLHRDLSDKQYIIFKDCSQLKFSSTGHLLAVAGVCNIEVYLFHRQERMHRFCGHSGSIKSMTWRIEDSELISCDDRGVTCAWNLPEGKQIWELTAEVSYTSVTTNSSEGDIVAVGLNKNVVCIRDGLIKWTIKAQKELTSIAFHEKTKLYYAGTKDGCIVSLSLPSPEAREVATLHAEEVTAISLIDAHSIIVSVSSDGLVMLTRIADGIGDSLIEIYSKLTMIDLPDLKKLQGRLRETELASEYIENMDKCEREVRIVQHEKMLRDIVLGYEKMINDLNEDIFLAREAIQLRQLEGEKEPEETPLERQLDEEVMTLTSRLGDAYQKTLDLGNENTALRLEYEVTLRDLNASHETFVSTEQRYQEKTKQKLKELECDLLQKEQEIIDRTKELENLRSSSEISNDESDNSTKAVNEPLEVEKKRLEDLEAEMERLHQMKKFRIADNRKRRDAATGQVDYDNKEKMDSITYLKSEFRKLENTLRTKEKFVQYQERKFVSTRTFVSFLRKKSVVARTELEDLETAISSEEAQIETYRQKVKVIQDSIPEIEEELEIVKGLTDTVTEKFQETNEGLKQKRKQLRATQEVLAKYTTLLHRCLSREYDLHRLVDEITRLFDDSRIDFADVDEDPRLHQEYQYQIEQLKRAYDMIKNEPLDATKQKAMAEFRLSQENSKILREVHEIQKKDEKLRTKLSLMEAPLLLQLGTVRKKGERSAGEDMRSKIEFVMNFKKRTKFVSIEMLDKFIENQQEEIVWFQTMLSEKSEG